MSRRPFHQIPFADLPEHPRLPHAFYETEGLDAATYHALVAEAAALGIRAT